MSVVTFAIIIVAGFLGGGAWEITARAGGGTWLAWTLAWIVAMSVYVIAPAVIG